MDKLVGTTHLGVPFALSVRDGKIRFSAFHQGRWHESLAYRHQSANANIMWGTFWNFPTRVTPEIEKWLAEAELEIKGTRE